VHAWHSGSSTCELRDAANHHALDAWESCVRERQGEFASPPPHGLAVVETMTANMFTAADVPVKEEHRRTTHNVRCWGARHNYSLVMHALPADVLRTGYSRPCIAPSWLNAPRTLRSTDASQPLCLPWR
jgi:hypothetical protein